MQIHVRLAIDPCDKFGKNLFGARHELHLMWPALSAPVDRMAVGLRAATF
jgi:hypothetical protein